MSWFLKHALDYIYQILLVGGLLIFNKFYQILVKFYKMDLMLRIVKPAYSKMFVIIFSPWTQLGLSKQVLI